MYRVESSAIKPPDHPLIPTPTLRPRLTPTPRPTPRHGQRRNAVQGDDRAGIVADVTKLLSNHSMNIERMETTVRPSRHSRYDPWVLLWYLMSTVLSIANREIQVKFGTNVVKLADSTTPWLNGSTALLYLLTVQYLGKGMALTTHHMADGATSTL